jgi:thymidylate kinase
VQYPDSTAKRALRNRRAVVVVLEGVDGSGKSALAAALMLAGRSLGVRVGYVRTGGHGSLRHGPGVSWAQCVMAVVGRGCFSAPRVWMARRGRDVVIVERGLWGEISHHPGIGRSPWGQMMLRALSTGRALRVIVDVREEVVEARISARDGGGRRNIEDTLYDTRARREALLLVARSVPERCFLVDGGSDALGNAAVILRHTRFMAGVG